MKQVAQELRAAQRILMSLHQEPDGDSIGSTLAVAIGLRRLGKQVTVATPDPVPRAYDFMPGVENISVGARLTRGEIEVTFSIEAPTFAQGYAEVQRVFNTVTAMAAIAVTRRIGGKWDGVDGGWQSAHVEARALVPA